MKKLRELTGQKTVRIIMLIILDIVFLALSSFLALAIRFEFTGIPSEHITTMYKTLIIDTALLLAIFAVFKLYQSMWAYASVVEFISTFLACVSFTAIEFTYKYLLGFKMPRSYHFLLFFLIFFFSAGIRFFYRFVRTMREFFTDRKDYANLMIIGAGQAGRLLITEIFNNPRQFTYDVKCVIDDNKNKIGGYIRGVPVVGDRTKIAKYADKYNIEEIIIAMPSADKNRLSLIVDECQKTKAEIKILPSISKMMDNPSMNQVRKLSYEDFLGRDQIVVDIKEIDSTLRDKTVIVTGGGGSIGSELCRQIAKCEPKRLIIFDIYENNAYDIEQELRRNYPTLDLVVIIGSVRDYDRLDNVFKTYQPEFVYHAAAHKHVPLMEVSPNEAIKNNCLGTLNTVKVADKYHVKKFVLVSTDKAVRPTNVMGATKRICEMIIQSYDKMSKTDYVAVRFGNVLGSNGSVIPLFLKQIEDGGPVTVTHKDITRFFMTIPEAVSLILQAGVYAKGGEIFVLDMGQPVRIYDLAEKIIRFKGYEPNVDMHIKITGLRPGEKLYEERLMEEEGLKKTPNKLISIGQPIKMDNKKFLKQLDELIKEAYKNGPDIKDKVAKIVDTYHVDKSV